MASTSNAYGLTETSPLITFCEPRPEHRELPLDERARITLAAGDTDELVFALDP